MRGGGWSYLWWYAFVFFASYAFQYPPLLVAVVLFFVLRRYIPDPVALFRTLGRISTLKRLVEANPSNVTARRDLAMIYLQQRRPGAALERIEEALKRFPTDAELLYLKGVAHHMRGEHALATQPLVDSVAADPRLRFGEPYLLAGDCLLELGKVEEAIDAYDRFLSINTSSIEGHVKKARAHAAADEKPAAKGEIDQALRVWAQIPGFQRRNQLGWWLRAHVARVIG
ncbi:MAG: tetratricopeptide repeat protein [Deltaproteobacteria bacterium]|nr:tetratricopeptide repeat protein [Deltaproteobacteria bacterium]